MKQIIKDTANFAMLTALIISPFFWMIIFYS